MNLPRLRELVKAWQDGSIREAELHELRDALPEVFEELDAALYLLGESDAKRFRLMKRNGELETIAGRYEALRLHEERTPLFVVPCSCGHSSVPVDE